MALPSAESLRNALIALVLPMAERLAQLEAEVERLKRKKGQRLPALEQDPQNAKWDLAGVRTTPALLGLFAL